MLTVPLSFPKAPLGLGAFAVRAGKELAVAAMALCINKPRRSCMACILTLHCTVSAAQPEGGAHRSKEHLYSGLPSAQIKHIFPMRFYKALACCKEWESPAARPRKELPMAARALCIQGSPVPSTTACTFCAASPSTLPSSQLLSDTAMSVSAAQ